MDWKTNLPVGMQHIDPAIKLDVSIIAMLTGSALTNSLSSE